MEAGSITVRHVDVLATAIATLEPVVAVDLLADEAALVDFARRATPETFAACLRQRIDLLRADGGMPRLERQRRDSRAHCTTDPDSGMYRLFAELDPERGTAITQAIQARMDRLYQTAGATDGLTPQQVRAQALFELITRSGDGDGCGFEVLVIVDHHSLVSGVHPGTVCETAEGIRLPISHVQSLCATATITTAILDADGKALAVGRCERVANRPNGGPCGRCTARCVHPDCDVPFDRCHIHHVQPWDHGGGTDLDNLVPVCHRHHHQIHDQRWTLTIDEPEHPALVPTRRHPPPRNPVRAPHPLRPHLDAAHHQRRTTHRPARSPTTRTRPTRPRAGDQLISGDRGLSGARRARRRRPTDRLTAFTTVTAVAHASDLLPDAPTWFREALGVPFERRLRRCRRRRDPRHRLG